MLSFGIVNKLFIIHYEKENIKELTIFFNNILFLSNCHTDNPIHIEILKKAAFLPLCIATNNYYY